MTPEIDPQQGQESRQNVRGIVPSLTRPIHLVVGATTAYPRQALADAPPMMPQRSRTTARRKWRKRLIALVVLAVAGGATAAYWQPLKQTFSKYASAKTSVSLANIQTYTVKRGEFRMTMVEEGKLRAVKNSTIRMGASGKITWLAEAGSKVKQGDKVAVIDSKQYEDQKRTMEADLETAIKQLEIAEKQVPIAEADGKAAIGNAETALGTAELALKTYTTIDVPKKLNDLETAINDAQAKLSDQQKKRIDLQKQIDEMLNEGDEKTKLQNDLSIAKTAEQSMRRMVTTAEGQLKLFRSYNYVQDLKTKQRAIENAKLDVTKANVKAQNDLLAKQADAARIKNSITRLQNNIKQYDDYISKCTAVAPTDGLVFYGGPDLERYGLSQDQIRVGADWYSNQPIMSIPDLSSFQVAVPIAEVYRGRVSIGMPATVVIDAIPGLALDGKLMSVSSVSRPKYQYDNSSPPVYDAMLSLDVADPRMVAGMTVRVEIATGTLRDVLYVPVEGVYNEEGKTAAFVWVEGPDPQSGHVEKWPVLTGQSNDHFVELKKGAREGDKLLLSRPASFVTPHDYREQVEAMFPPTTAPTTRRTAGPTSAPTAVSQAVGMAIAPATTPATAPAHLPNIPQ